MPKKSKIESETPSVNQIPEGVLEAVKKDVEGKSQKEISDMAVMFYMIDFFPKLRLIKDEVLSEDFEPAQNSPLRSSFVQTSKELKEKTYHKPFKLNSRIDLILAECDVESQRNPLQHIRGGLFIPSFREESMSGLQVVAIMVLSLYIKTGENREVSDALFSSWPLERVLNVLDSKKVLVSD